MRGRDQLLSISNRLRDGNDSSSSRSLDDLTTRPLHRTAACCLLPAICCLLLACPRRQADPPRLPLPAARLTVKSAELDVELARLPHERSRGLMYRSGLAPDSGMLFTFESAERHRFWMKNTRIPLDIAFLDAAGIITDILTMQPFDTLTDYSPTRAALFAIEMNAGWFERHAIAPGDTVKGIPGR